MSTTDSSGNLSHSEGPARAGRGAPHGHGGQASFSFSPGSVLIKSLLFMVALYGFLLSIELMGGAFKMFGKDFAETLLTTTTNPIMGLFVGLFATSLVQSSSLTTSVLVGMVASGALSLENAIPIVMGANMGTTVTSTLVSLGHVTRREEFGRAFSGATLHDAFNICAVMVFLPLEMTTHVLLRIATWMESSLSGAGGASFESPLKAVVKPVVNWIEGGIDAVAPGPVWTGVALLLIALVLLFLALRHMTSIMKGGVLSRIEQLAGGYLFKRPLRAMLLGAGFTSIVQSSSVTTSLVVPLVGAGALKLEKVYPYLLGANLGTTVTALLASTVTGSDAAIIVALAHFCFNLGGILVFYPLRFIPLGLASRLGRIARRSRWVAAAYILGMFFGLPTVLFLLFE